MDLRRTVAPRGTLTPNQFEVLLSQSDRARFAPIEEELVDELITVAKDHADIERYTFLGPVTVKINTDEELSPGMVLISSEIVRPDEPPKALLVLPDGTRRELGARALTIGRLPDCDLVLADPNVSRYHAEVRPASGTAAVGPNRPAGGDYEVSDMGSTNGTKVNGMPLTAARVLHEGDQITLGATTIRFERG
jgi:hypothetical protein